MSNETISVVDFTAYSKRDQKIYNNLSHDEIEKTISKMCQSYILHSITTYTVTDMKVKKYQQPFEIDQSIFNEYKKKAEKIINPSKDTDTKNESK